MNSIDSIQAYSASQAVFGTYELLENILTQPVLSTIDIVRAQQVSKQWHALAARSTVLRQKLFLECEPCDSKDFSVPGWELHPIFRQWQPNHSGLWSWACDDGRTIKVDAADLTRMVGKGQWQHMLLTKPRTQRLDFWYMAPKAKTAEQLFYAKDAAGVRLGVLAEQLQKSISRREKFAFKRVWELKILFVRSAKSDKMWSNVCLTDKYPGRTAWKQRFWVFLSATVVFFSMCWYYDLWSSYSRVQ